MTRAMILSCCLILLIGCRFSTEPATKPAIETPTPTPTPNLSPEPGLAIRGHVRLSDGSGLAGVKIYRAFATYPGNVEATTDQDGYFESDFVYIPGDEMVRVWAELEGYTFEPADAALTWESGVYYWRHYYGQENRILDFVALPAP